MYFRSCFRMRDRGIVLDPYLDHGVLVRVCAEVGMPLEELDPSAAGPAQVSFPSSFCQVTRHWYCIVRGYGSKSCLRGCCAKRSSHEHLMPAEVQAGISTKSAPVGSYSQNAPVQAILRNLGLLPLNTSSLNISSWLYTFLLPLFYSLVPTVMQGARLEKISLWKRKIWPRMRERMKDRALVNEPMAGIGHFSENIIFNGTIV